MSNNGERGVVDERGRDVQPNTGLSYTRMLQELAPSHTTKNLKI